MNLQIIQASIKSYQSNLEDASPVWDLVKEVHSISCQWSESEDPMQDYSRLFGTYINAWWPDYRNAVKSIERYITTSDDMVRSMFEDLLNEKRDISGRVGRFIHHCDTLYKHERKNIVHTLSHGHSDKEMIFLYLSTILPALYMPYDYKAMRDFLDKVGSKAPLLESDTERYVKVSRSLCKLMQKDAELVGMVQEQLESHHINEDAYWMMMTYGMIRV